MKTLFSAAALAAALGAPAFAQEDATAEAAADAAMSQGGTGALVDAEGAEIGNVGVTLTASGLAVVVIDAEGIPEGVHGFHFHMVGACDAPTFESAGMHLSGDRDHGPMVETGPHPGDMPNAVVQADGVMAMEAFSVGLTEELLYDEDGSALMVHAGPDDYTTQPDGDAGDRIACAVIERGAEPTGG